LYVQIEHHFGEYVETGIISRRCPHEEAGEHVSIEWMDCEVAVWDETGCEMSRDLVSGYPQVTRRKLDYCVVSSNEVCSKDHIKYCSQSVPGKTYLQAS
jgi:hypothetical protein